MKTSQVQNQIDKLEAAPVLGKNAANRLRLLKAALPEMQAKEDQRKAVAARGENYGAGAGSHSPAEKYLDGPAWDDFVTRYCDPKGILKAREAATAERNARTERLRKPLLKRRGQKANGGGAFSINGRKVVLTADIPVNRWVNLKTGTVGPVVQTTEIPVRAARVATPSKPMATVTRKVESARKSVLAGWNFGLEKALEFLRLAETDINALRAVRPALADNADRLNRLRQSVAQAQA